MQRNNYVTSTKEKVCGKVQSVGKFLFMCHFMTHMSDKSIFHNLLENCTSYKILPTL